MNPQTRPLAYIPQLDGLRAVAVSAVLVGHFYPRLFPAGFPIGYDGVILFFVLSGYLITRILLDCRDVRDSGQATTAQMLGRFYGRRALRLLPALWLALAVSWFFIPEVRASWQWHLSYLSNVYFIKLGGLRGSTGHLWSLSVEEQFYMVWPLLALGFARWKLAPLVVGLVISAPLARFIVASGGGSLVAVRTPPWACADALGVGVLLALYLSRSADPARLLSRVRNWCLPIGLVATVAVWALFPYATPWNVTLTPPAVITLSVGLVAGCIAGFGGLFGRLLESRPAIGLGRISYGLYVYHFFLLSGWERYAPGWLPHHPGWEAPQTSSLEQAAYFVLLTALSIAVASASWRWYEEPILRLKRHLSYGARKTQRARTFVEASPRTQGTA